MNIETIETIVKLPNEMSYFLNGDVLKAQQLRDEFKDLKNAVMYVAEERNPFSENLCFLVKPADVNCFELDCMVPIHLMGCKPAFTTLKLLDLTFNPIKVSDQRIVQMSSWMNDMSRIESQYQLEIAIRTGNLNLLMQTIHGGADVNFEPVTEVGVTPLVKAIAFYLKETTHAQDRLQIIQALINAGAEVNESNGANEPMLHQLISPCLDSEIWSEFDERAVGHKYFNILKILLRNPRTNINVKNTHNQTPLLYCVHLLDSANISVGSELIQKLLAGGADPTIPSDDGSMASESLDHICLPEFLKSGLLSILVTAESTYRFRQSTAASIDWSMLPAVKTAKFMSREA